MKIVKNGKGVSFNDRELAGEVRGMGLKHLKRILSDTYKDKEFQKRIIERLAASLLPRLNEHSGPDGGVIPLPIYGGNSTKIQGHNSDEEDLSSQKKN